MKGKKGFKRSYRSTQRSNRKRSVKRSNRRGSVKRSYRKRYNKMRKNTIRSNRRSRSTRRKQSGKRRVNRKYNGEGGVRMKPTRVLKGTRGSSPYPQKDSDLGPPSYDPIYSDLRANAEPDQHDPPLSQQQMVAEGWVEGVADDPPLPYFLHKKSGMKTWRRPTARATEAAKRLWERQQPGPEPQPGLGVQPQSLSEPEPEMEPAAEPVGPEGNSRGGGSGTDIDTEIKDIKEGFEILKKENNDDNIAFNIGHGYLRNGKFRDFITPLSKEDGDRELKLELALTNLKRKRDKEYWPILFDILTELFPLEESDEKQWVKVNEVLDLHRPRPQPEAAEDPWLVAERAHVANTGKRLGHTLNTSGAEAHGRFLSSQIHRNVPFENLEIGMKSLKSE